MASTMTLRIRDVTKEVWPSVQAALDQVTIRVREVAEVAEAAQGQLEEYLASNENAHRKRRAICNETVWAIARLGYLRSAADAKVIAAAKAYVETECDAASDEAADQAYSHLFDVVRELPSFDK